MIPLWAHVWGLRILALAILVLLNVLAGSGIPTLAFALAWGPNGLFLYLTMKDALHLPQVFVPVHPIEPVLYRWLGVGLIKRIVATRMWPLVLGAEPPAKPRNRQELFERTAQSTKVAEVCHGATFILSAPVSLYFLMVGRVADSAWMFAFNMLLNGYPVMLQRSNRYRVQQVRASQPR